MHYKDDDNEVSIGGPGTEKMYIGIDGTPYVHYSVANHKFGWNSRYSCDLIV